MCALIALKPSVRIYSVNSHENKEEALNGKVQTFSEGPSIIQVNYTDGIFRLSVIISLDMNRFGPLCLEVPGMLALQQEFVHLSPLICPFLPTRLTEHAYTLWVAISWNFVLTLGFS